MVYLPHGSGLLLSKRLEPEPRARLETLGRSLLRRDVDNSLRPRLTFLAGELGEEAAMQTVTANPRLLLSEAPPPSLLRPSYPPPHPLFPPAPPTMPTAN